MYPIGLLVVCQIGLSIWFLTSLLSLPPFFDGHCDLNSLFMGSLLILGEVLWLVAQLRNPTVDRRQHIEPIFCSLSFPFIHSASSLHHCLLHFSLMLFRNLAYLYSCPSTKGTLNGKQDKIKPIVYSIKEKKMIEAPKKSQ